MINTNFTSEDKKFMQLAIDLSIENVAQGGGPFGAVIVRNGEIIATGTNRVSAIRAACAKLGDFKLSGCTIYSSCEPCPMCLSALYWAGVERIFYGNTKQDAKSINFDDSFIYDRIALDYSERAIPCINFMREEALAGFKAWVEKVDKVLY